MFDAVAAVSLLRHHVAHRPGFHGRQFFVGDGGDDGLVRLSLRASRQDQLLLLMLRGRSECAAVAL